MRLVARRESFEDPHALLGRGLVDVDLLEAARERAVALEVAVLLIGRRAHAAERPVRQAGLQEVRGVDGRALGGAGAEDRVDLIDEEDEALALA